MLRIGQRVGNYKILRELGRGGMGIVYAALHHSIERRAAIKVLHANFAKVPELENRFVNAAVA